MSSVRLGFFSGFVLLLVAFASACSASEDSSDLGGGTGPEDGKFVPPPTKPEDGQKSSTPDTTAKKETPPAGSASKPPPASNTAGACGTPQCNGIAGFCACRSSAAGKQALMACNGGKCQCNGKSFADNGACGAKADAKALETLFAACSCD